MISKGKHFFWCILFLCMVSSCKKGKQDDYIDNKATVKTILYIIKGTGIKVNFIDSNSIFQSGQIYHGLFQYQFRKGSGAGIGISVFKETAADTIYSWSILIDGKLYANAFSEGGAYLTVPYN